MADLMKLKASLGLDSSEYESGLSKAEGKAKGFGGKWKAAMGVFKVGAAAVGAATGAVAAFTKKSVDAYAEFQQLEGGVKKLYGSASEELMHMANTAFERTGMSANQYMEQATSFSAALINSLGGDTSAAAKQTDVAMKAIADNFNTFGGDIGNVQNAFQGFAKQNYTMLDNLKLGYGGTKTEMERLIADANAYAEANGKAADLSIESFSDIVTAIDLIQEKQGIRGATEAEANKTIEGSLMALKGAWDNLLAGFANPDADIGALVSDVMERIGIAAENLGPAIMTALTSIGEAFSTMLPDLIAGLPKAIETYGVPLVQTGFGLVKNLVTGLIQAAPSIISTAFKLVGDLLMGIAQGLPQVLVMGINLITSIIQGFTQGSGDLTSKFGEILQTLGAAIVEAMPALGAAMLGLAEALGNYFLKTNWLALGLKAFRAVLSGIRRVVPTILSTVSGAVSNVLQKMGFSGAAAKARSAFESIRNAIKSKIESARDTVKGVIEKIKGLFPFSISKAFNLPSLPKVSVSTTYKTVGPLSIPIPSFSWNAKAMHNPYLFSGATLFGAGETGDEVLYGRQALMRDIKEAAGNTGSTINVYLNYQAGDDANDMLRDIARGIQRYKMAGVI